MLLLEPFKFIAENQQQSMSRVAVEAECTQTSLETIFKICNSISFLYPQILEKKGHQFGHQEYISKYTKLIFVNIEYKT